MKYILFCLLMFGYTGYSQQGTTFVLKGQRGLIDKKYEKIIGDTILWCNETNGKKVPDKYWIVKYDYGNPPPDYLLVMKWVLTEMPTSYYEWKIEVKEGPYLQGTDGFLYSSQIIFTCEKPRFFNPKYTYSVFMTERKIEVQMIDTQ